MPDIGEFIPASKMLIKPDTTVNLKDFDTEYSGDELKKKDAESLLEESRRQLAEIQDKLYAHNKYSVLIIFQAMDAAGKDSAIKHIMSGFNPQGVKVYSFKAPSSQELDHDYLWRHARAMPGRGEIAIHNRSHYENVLISRVHPEFILKEQIPGAANLDAINKDFWERRFKQINRFEKNLAENGMLILKFFLHVSKKEQRKRFLERIDDPTKNWKFSMGDLTERKFWKDYQHAYEEAIAATSKDHAPWFVIPADSKWYTRLAIASIITTYFTKLDLCYPTLDELQKAELQKAKLQLMDEKNNGEK